MTSTIVSSMLFWKVFRNKYLFNKILNSLDEIQHYYLDYRKYQLNNRFKHKHLTSLGWFIANEQYELLKYKILSNPDEYMDFDTKGIVSLIKVVGENTKRIDDGKPLEILKLLLENRYNEIDMERLVHHAVVYKRLVVLELVLNEPYSLKTSPSTSLYLAIRTCTPHIVDLIIKNSKDTFDKISNRYGSPINQLRKKTKYSNEMVEYMISNPQYFENKKFKPHLKIFGNFSYMPTKLLDYIELSKHSFSTCLNYLIQQKPTVKITIEILKFYFQLYINSMENVDQLDIQLINNRILEIENDGNGLPNKEKKKNIFKLIIVSLNSGKLYKLYYFKYFESIKEFQNNYKYMDYFSKLRKLSNILSNDDDEKRNLIIDQIKWFATNFVPGKKLLNYKKLIGKITNIIGKTMDTKEYYDKLIESIPEDKRYLFNLPLEYNSLLKQMMVKNGKLIFQDVESIDWILKYSFKSNQGLTSDIKSIYYLKRRLGLVEFTSNYLIGYASKVLESFIKSSSKFKSITLHPIKWSEILNNPLEHTIIQLNLNDTILSINDHCLSILNVDNLNGFYKFKPMLIKQFIQEIKIQQNTTEILSTIKNDKLKEHSNELVQLLFISIIDYDLNVCKFIFNHLNFNDHLKQFNRVWQDSILDSADKRLSNLLFSWYDIYTIKNQDPEIIMSFINYWLEIIKVETTATTTQTPPELISTYQLIINHLYKRLIQVQSVTIEQVSIVRKSIINCCFLSNFKLDHSLYHSFYYINIKSSKLINYIINVGVQRAIRQTGYYDADTGNDNTNSNVHQPDIVEQLLDPNLYTYELTIGENRESFDNILERFRNFKKENEGLNSNPIHFEYQELVYCLKISRKDLYLKRLLAIYEKDNTISMDLFHGDLPRRYNQDLSNLKEIIDLFLLAYKDDEKKSKKFIKKVLKSSIQLNAKETTSFLIDEYYSNNGTTISITVFSNKYYSMLDYIINNHPNIKFKWTDQYLTKFTECCHYYGATLLKIISRYLKYFPNDFKINNRILQSAINNNDKILLNYYQNLGYIQFNLQSNNFKITNHNNNK